MSKATAKTSSLMSGLRSSFSSGKGLSLAGKKSIATSKKSDTKSAILSQSQQNKKPVIKEKVAAKPVLTTSPQPVVTPTKTSTSEPLVNNPQQETLKTPEVPQLEKLNTLSTIIDEVESQRETPAVTDPLESVAQVVPQAVNAIQDHLNPPNPAPVGAAKKEAYVPASGAAIETPVVTVEHPGGVQTVEQERTPEISPELESFLKHAKDQPEHLPQEIVVADNQEVSAVTHYPKKPVIVLPITAKDQAKGKNKSPKLSIRWLVEWSVKLMKKFTGKVIYREE